MCVAHVFHEAVDVLLYRDIGLHGRGVHPIRAQRSHQVVRFIRGVVVIDDNAGTGMTKGCREGAPYSAGATRYQRNSTGQIHGRIVVAPL